MIWQGCGVKKTILYVLLFCCGSTALVGSACLLMGWFLPPYGAANWDNTHKQESIRIGATIVAGIEAYYSDHHRYPGTLDELVPRYLPTIPPATAGDGKWKYFSRKDEFYLQFSVPSGYPSYNYHHKTGQWQEDS